MTTKVATWSEACFERWLRSLSFLTGARHFHLRRISIEPARFTGQNERAALCIAELEQLHGMIYWYDTIVMHKKSWFIALWSLLSAFGLYRGNPSILWLPLAVIAGFAMSELVLRRYQRRYVVRAEQVERIAASGDLSGYRYGLSETAGKSSRRQELWYALAQPHFTLFYGFFVLVSLIAAVFGAKSH